MKIDFLKKHVSSKHIFFFENPVMPFFQDYITFIKRVGTQYIDSLKEVLTKVKFRFSVKKVIEPSANAIKSMQ